MLTVSFLKWIEQKPLETSAQMFLDSQTHVEIMSFLGTVMHACNPDARKADTWISGAQWPEDIAYAGSRQ